MGSLIAAFLVGRATGGWRYMRVALLIIVIACVVAGFIYAIAMFNAVRSTPEGHHVQHHSSQ